MEDYLRKLRQFKHHSSGHHNYGHGHHGDASHYVRKFKKFAFIAVSIIILGIICLVILAIVGLTWLFNRGDVVKQAGENLTSQAQSIASPLNLDSYISNNQVDTQKLQQTYEALPSQLQDDWLRQFKAQIDELQSQAGVSNETIQSLLSLYNTLQ